MRRSRTLPPPALLADTAVDRLASMLYYISISEGNGMLYFEFIWNEELGGNLGHISEHGLEPDDVEEVILNPVDRDVSRSSGLPIVFGFTPDGRYILVVYE
jgi:hypothetical protein